MNNQELVSAINELPGPILVTGAGGFVGAHLYATLLADRKDVFGTIRQKNSWRLRALGIEDADCVDLTNKSELRTYLDLIKPRTLFNLAAYGAYSHQTSVENTYKVNLEVVENLAEWCSKNNCLLIQTGSSSEYGTNCAGPSESSLPSPNSRYAVSKLAATNLLAYLSENSDLRSNVVRLYSIYGPLEDSSRLIPTLIRKGLDKELPSFSQVEITRDFVYVNDAVVALIKVGRHLELNQKFEIFNLATGTPTKMFDVARISKEVFRISQEPIFTQNLRKWDLTNWYGNPEKLKRIVGWKFSTSFEEGLKETLSWYRQKNRFEFLELESSTSRQNAIFPDGKISVVIACYKDDQAIPEMYRRLKSVFSKSGLEHEIIFVNDCSPDNSSEIIRSLSAQDSNVIGINHARNFGSQAAFLSGLKVSKGDACVLMDGDLQDPPEIITEFIEKWKSGFDVVYGVRIKREAPWFMQVAYKAFYRVLAAVSPFKVPVDAGDFSLISRPVVNSMLAFGERDAFLRISRAYSGHLQCGVEYFRPERPFGTSTNNLAKNIGWALKGVLSVGKKPLTYLSLSGLILFSLTTLLLLIQLFVKLFFPESAPPGAVTNILVTMFFGSVNLFGISILGEYVGRILEEVRNRPRFIVKSITQFGENRINSIIDGVD